MVIKEAYNFYIKNYNPYLLLNQPAKKYEENTDIMLENQLPKVQEQSSPK